MDQAGALRPVCGDGTYCADAGADPEHPCAKCERGQSAATCADLEIDLQLVKW